MYPPPQYVYIFSCILTPILQCTPPPESSSSTCILLLNMYPPPQYVSSSSTCILLLNIYTYSPVHLHLYSSVLLLLNPPPQYVSSSSICTADLLYMHIRWVQLAGSLKTYVSFAKEPYTRDYILQKEPIILRSLLIVDTPYLYSCILLLLYPPPQYAYIYSSICIPILLYREVGG